jgi:hypothetical protein
MPLAGVYSSIKFGVLSPFGLSAGNQCVQCIPFRSKLRSCVAVCHSCLERNSTTILLRSGRARSSSEEGHMAKASEWYARICLLRHKFAGSDCGSLARTCDADEAFRAELELIVEISTLAGALAFRRRRRAIHVRVGMEATGYARWFERLLAELGFELWIGDPAEIKTRRRQKTENRSQGCRTPAEAGAGRSLSQNLDTDPGESRSTAAALGSRRRAFRC